MGGIWGGRRGLSLAGVSNVRGSEGRDGRDEDAPTRRLKAAGLRLSRELSSLRGARHFWQYIVSGLLHSRKLNVEVEAWKL